MSHVKMRDARFRFGHAARNGLAKLRLLNGLVFARYGSNRRSRFWSSAFCFLHSASERGLHVLADHASSGASALQARTIHFIVTRNLLRQRRSLNGTLLRRRSRLGHQCKFRLGRSRTFCFLRSAFRLWLRPLPSVCWLSLLCLLLSAIFLRFCL